MKLKTSKEVNEICRKFVIDHDIKVIDIAYNAGVSVQTVYNFLKGINGNNIITDYLIETYGEEMEVV